MIHGTCSDDYNGDPGDCDVDFQDEVSATCNHPSAKPTIQPTMRPTNHADLSPGSVVVIGYDQQENSFEVACLVNVPMGTNLRFTGQSTTIVYSLSSIFSLTWHHHVLDNRYSNVTGLGKTEGTVAVDVLEIIPAGTTWVVNVDTMSVTKNGTHYSSLGNLTSVNGAFNLAQSGDNIFIYLGDPDEPVFVFGFASKQWVHLFFMSIIILVTLKY